MIIPGLCSITFRKLPVEKVVDLTVENRLSAIEWGGDVHVPVGQLGKARDVGRLSREAGLKTPSYGSYFRFGEEKFEPVVETAAALGASIIRVWAGSRPSAEMDAGDWERLIQRGRESARLAGQAGVRIGFEYHLGTATDTNETALRLMREIDHPAAQIYWQPRQAITIEQRLSGLREALPHLAHLHVFHWIGERDTRLPLSEGAEDWRKYFACAAEAPGERCAYLEFVKDDAVENFARDAATLRELLAS